MKKGFCLGKKSSFIKNFLKWLINWCCAHLYLEGSYAQRHLVILVLHWLISLHGSQGVQSLCREK